jgi:hypothetical protein
MDPYTKGFDPDEFDVLIGDVRWIDHHQDWRRRRAADALVEAGPRAVRPVALALEIVVRDRDATDEDIERISGRAADIVRRIGRDAIPELRILIDDGGCNLLVVGWAEDLVHELDRSPGYDPQLHCRHTMKVILTKGGRRAWTCLGCGAEFGRGGRPSREPTRLTTRRGRPRKQRHE